MQKLIFEGNTVHAKRWFTARWNLHVCFSQMTPLFKLQNHYDIVWKPPVPRHILLKLFMCFLTKKKPTKQNPPGQLDYTKSVFLLLLEELFAHPNVEHVLNICQLQLGNAAEYSSQINGWAKWFPPGIKWSFHIHCFEVFSCSTKVFQKANLGYTSWEEMRSNST